MERLGASAPRSWAVTVDGMPAAVIRHDRHIHPMRDHDGQFSSGGGPGAVAAPVEQDNADLALGGAY